MDKTEYSATHFIRSEDFAGKRCEQRGIACVKNANSEIHVSRTDTKKIWPRPSS